MAVKVREAQIVRPAGFDLPEFWSHRLAEFEGSRPRVEVEVRIQRTRFPSSNACLRRVIARRSPPQRQRQTGANG